MKNISCLISHDWFWGLSLGIAAIIKVFVLLSQSEFLCSWDAYYYLIQVRAIIEEGSMHSSDYSLIYPYFTMLQLLIGDYILAYKIGNALLTALFAVMFFFCLKSLCKNKAVVILIVLFTLISPVITYLIIQFPKNTLGLIGLVFLVGALLRQNYKLGFIAMLICLFSHRISLVLGVVFLLFMLVSRKMALKIALILACLTLMIIIFPVIINIHDLERFKGLFGNSFQFAPFSFYRIIHNGEANWFWLSYVIAEVVLLLVSICFIIYGNHFRGRLNYYTALVFLAVVLLFPLYNMSFDGPAVRLYLSYSVFIPFWFVPLFTIISLKAIWFCNLLLILVFLGSIVLFDDKNYAPPYSDYLKITKNIQFYANPYK